MKQLSAYTWQEINKIWSDLTRSKTRYLLLTGGVGVGKTLYAKVLANLIAGKDSKHDAYDSTISSDRIELFSFGPHYSHENFIYGLSVSGENGGLTFKESKKRFLELCGSAIDRKGENFVAIFDDINRADISQTLGDLLSALESKDPGNEIHAGNERISLPDNLYIIATANPLVGKEKLDYAWMRRFMHYNILSDEKHLGFDYDGKDAGDGYQDTIDKAWRECYKEIDKKRIIEKKTKGDPSDPIGISDYEWRKKDESKEIECDTNEAINPTGKAFLRQYQWDIYMHIKIMYERYFFDPDDDTKIQQYLPGHGMFLTCNNALSYGENLVLFHKQLRHTILPLIEKQFSDGLLNKEAELDIEALTDLTEGKSRYKVTANDRWRESKPKEKNVNVYIFLDPKSRTAIVWPEYYLFIMCSLPLRRLNQKKPTRYLYSFIVERKNLVDADEFSSGKVNIKFDKKGFYPCHTVDKTISIRKYDFCGPAYVTYGRRYSAPNLTQNNKDDKRSKKRKGSEKVNGLVWGEWPDNDMVDEILRLLMQEELKIELRRNAMRNAMSQNDISEPMDIMDALGIRQMILQGPPGTSKTYRAKYKIIASEIKRLSREEGKGEEELLKQYQITDYDNWNENESYGWDMVQFHPSYGYEDFVRGITVSTNNNQVVYETVNKILGKMCKLAEKKYKDNKGSKFFLIIDEINRADIATVFGELIYALECRGEAVSIPYAIDGDYKLTIPENLYIIGTMNTADKSIGTIDYAIRRRFLFFDCLPDKEVVRKYIVDNTGLKDTALDLEKQAVHMMENLKKFIDDAINDNYHAKDLYIGHTYFLVDSEEKLRLRLQYQILPILREYYENGVLTKLDKSGFQELKDCITGKKEYSKALFKALFDELTKEPDNS